MTRRERSLAMIERLETHAWILLAKASPKSNPAPECGRSVPRPTSPRVKNAERMFAKAAILRKSLVLREAAKAREREIRQQREAEREVPFVGRKRSRTQTAGAR